MLELRFIYNLPKISLLPRPRIPLLEPWTWILNPRAIQAAKRLMTCLSFFTILPIYLAKSMKPVILAGRLTGPGNVLDGPQEPR
jgi:hypothetical protein